MRSIRLVYLLSICSVLSCKTVIENKDGYVKFDGKHPSHLVAKLPGQYPEGIEFDKYRKVFFLSAINKNPIISTVNFREQSKPFSKNGGKASSSSFGLQIDYINERLLACVNNSEYGGVHIYDLKLGTLERVINLSSILENDSEFQANDLIFDDEGYIYVTGRLENLVYKINKDLEHSVFFQRKDLTKPNGIVYHPNNYVLVSYINDNSKLVKIPTKNPDSAKNIKIEGLDFIGFDGMIINQKGNLVAVMKVPNSKLGGYVVELSSEDDWSTAKVVNKVRVNRSTTIVETALNEYYVLNQDWKKPNAETWILEKVSF